MVGSKRTERVPLRVLLVMFAIAATAWAVSNILGARSDRDNLDACAASFRGDAVPGSSAFAREVATACAPLFRQRPCRDALAALGATPEDRTFDLGAAVDACAEAYCDRLDPPPPACGGAAPDHADRAETLLAAILRGDHSGYDEAAEIGALIARALTAPASADVPAPDLRGTPP